MAICVCNTLFGELHPGEEGQPSLIATDSRQAREARANPRPLSHSLGCSPTGPFHILNMEETSGKGGMHVFRW